MENSQVLPDPRRNSQRVQGWSTGAPEQPWPHPFLPFSFAKCQVLLFTALIPSKTNSLPC